MLILFIVHLKICRVSKWTYTPVGRFCGRYRK